ncbi:DUF6541 family protein [Microbacterium aerolatum]|uniref:DUF6541 family protein n=1 Tax=Microbacterium aerolatum TaxID=153731 RepID=UPI0038509392
MILEWLAQTPVLLVAILVMFVPGALVLRLLGQRGLAALATAPLVTIAATAVVAVMLGIVGIPWTVVSWLIGTLVVLALVWGIGRLVGLKTTPLGSPTRRWVLPLMVGVGVTLGVWRLAAYISDPAGISQTNDAVFHMNAVRFILETANASSLHVNGFVGGTSFYPAAWHALTSVIVLLTGTTIPIAANMLTLVIGAFVWPLGIVWLTRTLTESDAVAGYAGILSSALQTFPLLMFQWGVLFPNALSTSLIPAGVALILTQWGRYGEEQRVRTVARVGILAFLVVAALGLSQPSALLTWAALVLVWASDRLLRTPPRGSLVRAVLAIGALWIALIAVWIVLSRGTSGSHWPPFRGKLEVFLDVLLNGQLRVPFAFGISALMMIGLVVAWRSRRLRWFVFGWLGVSALYVLVAAIGAPLVRQFILGAWYADPYRIAALAPIVVIPLAALGFSSLFDVVVRIICRRRGVDDSVEAPPAAIGAAVLTALMIVLVALRPVAMPAFLEGTFDRESRYLAANDSYLSPDERELLEMLPDLVEPEERVLGNPSTGSGFGYMLSGMDVYPRTWSAPQTEAWEVLAERLHDAATDTDVCAALDAYGGPEYVLDFGPGERAPGRYLSPGMTEFEGRSGFEQVVAVGDVSLWRITACAR